MIVILREAGSLRSRHAASLVVQLFHLEWFEYHYQYQVINLDDLNSCIIEIGPEVSSLSTI